MIIIKPKLNLAPLIFAVCIGALLFSFPESALNGAKSGVEICLKTLIPSLFPIMALSTFILRTNALYLPCRALRKVTKFLFCLPENAGQIIFMALIGGYPVGLKMVSDSVKSGEITENEAKRLSMFCMNAGPAFTVTALGVGIYGNELIGIVIFISLCISTLLIGIFTRFFSDGKSKSERKSKPPRFSGDEITYSVWNAFQSMLKISAWVILFGAITACITEKLGNVGQILSSVLEVTGGTVTASKICPVPVVTALTGFGGFCVHCQVLSFLRDSNLQYKKFLAGRLVNSALSAVICHLIFYFFPIDQSVAYTFESARVSAISVSAPTVVAFFFMCMTFIFSIDRKEKMC